MSERFEFAPVRALDRGAICDFAGAIWGEAAREEVLNRWWLRSNFADTKAAVSADGQIAAVCVGIRSEWELPGSGTTSAISICGWYVAPQFGGRGLGKALVQSFADEAGSLNALSISDAAARNFAKLGWLGPFPTYLRILPFPALRRAPPASSGNLEFSSYTAFPGKMPEALAAALDKVDAAKPMGQVRRKRRASDWRAHLAVRPNRRPRFHVVSSGGNPLGYFVIRATDDEAGRLYRWARLHYVSDFVVNSSDSELLRLVFASMAQLSPSTAGALLLCSSSALVAKAAEEAGWIGEEDPFLGNRLAAKAPLYMLAGDLAPFAGGDLHLTFADSDVDLNI